MKSMNTKIWIIIEICNLGWDKEWMDLHHLLIDLVISQLNSQTVDNNYRMESNWVDCFSLHCPN